MALLSFGPLGEPPFPKASAKLDFFPESTKFFGNFFQKKLLKKRLVSGLGRLCGSGGRWRTEGYGKEGTEGFSGEFCREGSALKREARTNKLLPVLHFPDFALAIFAFSKKLIDYF